MSVPFPHEDEAFRELIEATAERFGIAASLVEKDYWVTHALWAIQEAGLELWFKGGTSLSKGFQLIHRFSEDLDIKVDHPDLPAVRNWTSESTGHRRSREAFFAALLARLPVHGADGVDMSLKQDEHWRSANYRVLYPGTFKAALPGALKDYVLLEVGSARVVPSVERDLTSFAHQLLEERGLLAQYSDNRPKGVRCVHPLVTLLEKLEAISRHFVGGKDAPGYVRHYEDAAAIIRGQLPPLEAGPAALYAQMRETKDVRRDLAADDVAYAFGTGEPWPQLAAAYAAIQPMFWGPRVPLSDACITIREWIAEQLPPPA